MPKFEPGPYIADLTVITVRSNVPRRQEYQPSGDEYHLKDIDGDVIALWERDDAHPNGEVLVKGSDSVRVARTERVVAKLRNKELVQVPDMTE